MKRYLAIAGLFLLVGTLSVVAWYAGTGKITATQSPLPKLLALIPGQKSVPKEIASLPDPVTKVVGRVEKLEGDVLTVTQRFPDGDIQFKVSLTPQTNIIKPRPFIPYLLKTVHADVADLQTRADLTPGTLVTVTTAKDLRETGTKNPVPATVVEVSVYNTSVQGTIGNVTGNSFTLQAAVPALPPNIPTTRTDQAKERTYTATYSTGTTELSRKKDGEPLKVHPDELKVGATVTVYATSDVTLLQTIPAVLIRFTDE